MEELLFCKKKCEVVEGETPDSLKAKVQNLEGEAFIEVIRWCQQERLLKMAGLKGITYADAGVNISEGDRFVEKIKPYAKATARPGSNCDLGGFGGLFDLAKAGYTDPILVSGTDGVGTKLKLAHTCKIHHTVGIDLVAMNVNDVLVQGAEPLFFLDYYATGKLDVEEAAQVIKGISEGCRQSNCALIGGETAEMPGMYTSGEYDLAGFVVGAVNRSDILPKLSAIQPGDAGIGIASSGIHSNGYSLVRHIISKHAIDLFAKPPFPSTHATLGEALLVPTKIYVRSVLPLMKESKIKAAAHITGGGLIENIPRVLPDGSGVDLDMQKWNVHEVFKWLYKTGGLEVGDVSKTLNLGIGMVLVVNKDDVPYVCKKLIEKEEVATHIGTVVELKGRKQIVQISNTDQLTSFCE